MPIVVVAVTHQTIPTGLELQLLAQQRIAIGTSIVGRAAHNLDARERADVELLELLGKEGGLAIVTYGKNNQRWLGRVAPQTSVVLVEGLRSLQLDSMMELPRSLRRLNTIGSTIRLLQETERDDVILEAVQIGLLSSPRN
jgi:hypothetical protein